MTQPAMNVVVRADSSLRIGSGHVMRCLTLAGCLRDAGHHVTFLCRDLPGNVSSLVERDGFPVARATGSPADADAMPNPIDWLVVDHYELAAPWESTMRGLCRRILVIDDLADRPHDCDMLLDQNLTEEGEARYRGLVPENCTLLCGPAHALLRPEFAKADRPPRTRDGIIRRILVTFGGVDATGETLKTARAIWSLDLPDLTVDLVVGASNPKAEELRRLCDDENAFTFHQQVDDIAALMRKADLCVGAGGTTTWERAYLGLPTITISVAENQVPGALAMAEAGAAWSLGSSEDADEEAVMRAVFGALRRPRQMRDMSLKARALFGDRSVSAGASLAKEMKDSLHADA
jgi:UDP-2,4-diacetamido-2,4,6-trideoxy-beta-L-altropyranose hydrolase